MFVKYMLNPLTFLPPFFFGFTKHFVPKSVQDGHMVVGFGNDSKEGIRSISYVFVTDVEAIGIRNVCTAIFLCVFFYHIYYTIPYIMHQYKQNSKSNLIPPLGLSEAFTQELGSDGLGWVQCP